MAWQLQRQTWNTERERKAERPLWHATEVPSRTRTGNDGAHLAARALCCVLLMKNTLSIFPLLLCIIAAGCLATSFCAFKCTLHSAYGRLSPISWFIKHHVAAYWLLIVFLACRRGCNGTTVECQTSSHTWNSQTSSTTNTQRLCNKYQDTSL